MSYSHRQKAPALRAAILAVVAVAIYVLVATLRSQTAEDEAAVVWITSTSAVLLAIVGYLFNSLTVSVEAGEIRARFGPGWPGRTIAVSEVRAARPVRNAFWYGFGIRWTPHGWLYNVHGLDAVELHLADDTRFRIGTDEPIELTQAILIAAGLES